MKKALIAGITGQDGFYLQKYLKSKNYKILGLSKKKNKSIFIKKTDYSQKSLLKIISKFNPDEIYNLSGFSSPELSWEHPHENFYANFTITLNFLEIIKKVRKKIKYFNASSSEIFAKSEKLLNENSKIFPLNPYGISKSASYFLVDAYRRKYKLFLVNGILFNHSSYKSKNKFLLKYIFNSIIKFKKNKSKKINIRDSRPIRDIGCANEFVEFFYELMQLKKSDNYIIASGKSYSVKQITQIFEKKFNISKGVFNFKNSLNFINLNKVKKANNLKLLKALKIKSVKALPEVIDLLMEEHSSNS